MDLEWKDYSMLKNLLKGINRSTQENMTDTPRNFLPYVIYNVIFLQIQIFQAIPITYAKIHLIFDFLHQELNSFLFNKIFSNSTATYSQFSDGV